jgi:hypothetical protein
LRRPADLQREERLAIVTLAASAAIVARVVAPAPKHVPASVSTELACSVERLNIRTAIVAGTSHDLSSVVVG